MSKKKLSPASERAVQDFAATARALGAMAPYHRNAPQQALTKAAFARAETQLRKRLLRLEQEAAAHDALLKGRPQETEDYDRSHISQLLDER